MSGDGRTSSFFPPRWLDCRDPAVVGTGLFTGYVSLADLIVGKKTYSGQKTFRNVIPELFLISCEKLVCLIKY